MRKLLLALVAAIGVIALPTVAFAADTDLEESKSAFELAPLAVTVVLGTLIPILTGLVTKLSASPALKGVVNLTLAAAAGLITASLVDNGSAVFSDESLILAGVTWIQSVAAYFGLWRSFDIDAKLAPSVGVG